MSPIENVDALKPGDAEPAEGLTSADDMVTEDPNRTRDEAAVHESELQVERDERRERLGHYKPGDVPADDSTTEPEGDKNV